MVPSRQMHIITTASFLDAATAAFLKPLRSCRRRAQARNGDGFLTCVISVVAAE